MGQLDYHNLVHMPEPRYITAQTAIADHDQYDSVIDVRTPIEYELDRFPGALNLPVLSNEERVEIGTMYKQVSAFAARKRGAAMVAKAIASHLETVLAEKPKNWRPLIYCWRGGMRSNAMAVVLSHVGWQVSVITGGYQAYRRALIPELGELCSTLKLQVLCGETGSGKSRLLQALSDLGEQTLDLEALAHHRGSVLGFYLNEPQPSQKMFESRLLKSMLNLDRTQPVWIESESSKIGQLRVPPELISNMRSGRCFVIRTPQDQRVELLLDEYRQFTLEPASLELQLDRLNALHGRKRIDGWKQLIRAGEWRAFVGALLCDHYDPAYQHSMPRNFTHYPAASVIVIESTSDEGFAAGARRLVACSV
jgi:tRNA 2-selenouridine synthase